MDFSQKYSNPLAGKLLFADISYNGYRYFGYIQAYPINGYSYGGASLVFSISPITLVYWTYDGLYRPQSIVYWNCNNKTDTNGYDAYQEDGCSGWTDYVFNNIYAGGKPK